MDVIYDQEKYEPRWKLLSLWLWSCLSASCTFSEIEDLQFLHQSASGKCNIFANYRNKP
jgi:hypothetical protein